MFNFKFYIKKATFIVAFFILSICDLNFAQAETNSDLIEKAYNLSIQKNRLQSIGILTQALKKDSKKGKISKELISTLNEISQTFYSDKAQQLYESALSLRMTDTNAALSKLNEALLSDKDNLIILLEIGRNLLSKNDCDKALETAQKAKEIYIYIEEVDLLISQSLVCSGKLEKALDLKPTDIKISEFYIFWQLLLAEVQYRKNDLISLRNTLNEAAKNENKDPQIYYWQWKLQLGIKESAVRDASKYISECKKLTSRKIRELIYDPFLCRNTVEVENYLKKNNNP